MTGNRVSAASLRAWERHLGHPISDVGALVDRLTAGTLPAAFSATAHRNADRVAVTIAGETLTHGELERRSAVLAHALAELGARPGQSILVSAAASVSFVVAYLAGLRTGATVVLAGPQSAERELEHMITDSGAVMAIAEPPALGRIAAIARRRGAPAQLMDLHDSRSEDTAPAEALTNGPPLQRLPTDSAAPAVLAYTSGTTGRPKGVPLTHANLLSSIRAVMLAWRWSADDVLVHALSMTHQHGLGGLHATLLAGSRLVVLPRFDPIELAHTLVREHATVLFAVPAIYERLVTTAGATAAVDLRLVVSGSAPLSPALGAGVEALLGQRPLERYGTTESGLDVSNLYDDRALGVVGVPLPGVELEILAADGSFAQAGVDGEIILRGPQVFSGYHGRPEATAEAFLPGNWFRSGDVGRVDPDSGLLAITGRLKEVIISGGFNVYPREVEEVLEDHPAVARAAVIGIPSQRWGEEVVAVVVPSATDVPLPQEALAQHVAERLSAYKRPKRYVPVDALPVNTMGKVLRVQLAERIAADPAGGPTPEEGPHGR